MNNFQHVGSRANLSETQIRDSVERLDWPTLERYLRSRTLAEREMGNLCQILLRCSSLILRYPNGSRQKRRDSFLAELVDFVRTHFGSDAATKIKEAADTIATAERGYRSLLALLDQSEAGKRPADECVAALLSLAAGQVCTMLRQLHERVSSSSVLDGSSFALRDENNILYPAEHFTGMVDTTTSAALVMYAIREGWASDDDIVVLPNLPKVGDRERDFAYEVQRLADAWLFWERVEERCRYDGGNFTLSPLDVVDGATETGILIRYEPPEEALKQEKASVANYERLTQEIHSIYHELAFRTDARSRVSSPETEAPLYPSAFISMTELESAYALDFMLSTSIAEDKTRYLGLRLVEWLRGYSALALMADRVTRTELIEPDRLIWAVDRKSLCQDLVRLGLKLDQARMFLERVTFRRTSIEVVDEPLISLADGRLLIFGPSLVGAVPARIIPSKLLRAGVRLESRGRRFEKEVKAWFTEWGLNVYSIQSRRDGENYEYDAVVPWGKYIFIFECKSRGLVTPGPIQRHHASSRLKRDVAQTKRLADALRRHPDILSGHVENDVEDRVIIPCILNALPFGIPGSIDGVYCTDISSLGIFFEVGSLDFSVTHHAPPLASVRQILGQRRLWAGQEPTPEDLLRLLDEAPIHSAALDRLEQRDARAKIGSGVCAEAPIIMPRPETLEDLATQVGVDPSELRRTLSSFGVQLQAPNA